ncbi:MAG: tRNA pseudouridine(13) synthase TruD [bacterium]|nr:tRNA pseudouridine(13) synthase TruD [bacterium]
MLAIERQINYIKKNGFPNYFGIQRFGKGLKNRKRAEKIFNDPDLDPQNYQFRFQIQARVSMHFNRMLYQKLKQGNTPEE